MGGLVHNSKKSDVNQVKSGNSEELKNLGEDYDFIVEVRDLGEPPDFYRKYLGSTHNLPDLNNEGLKARLVVEILGKAKTLSQHIEIEGYRPNKNTWVEIPHKQKLVRVVPTILIKTFLHDRKYSALQAFSLRGINRTLNFVEILTNNSKALKSSPFSLLVYSGCHLVENILHIRRCKTCTHFDRKKGHMLYTEETHKNTLAGDRRMFMDISDTLADSASKRALDPSLVGLCIEHDTLIQDNYAGCVDWRRNV